MKLEKLMEKVKVKSQETNGHISRITIQFNNKTYYLVIIFNDNKNPLLWWVEDINGLVNVQQILEEK